MLRFLALRLARAALTIALVVTFAFVVLRLSGDPALTIMSPEAPAAALAAFRHAWGLDQPIWVQYFRYFTAILHGELGQSMRDGRPAIVMVAETAPVPLPPLEQPAASSTAAPVTARKSSRFLAGRSFRISNGLPAGSCLMILLGKLSLVVLMVRQSGGIRTVF